MTEERMKLYRVVLRGMTSSLDNPAYGDSYVIAPDPAQAYDKVKAFLDKKDIGFYRHRELDRVELIADAGEIGNYCGHMLFL
jgi:hypothetical protein